MTTPLFRATMERTKATTISRDFQTTEVLSNIPMEMKNRLLKRSRNGRMSETTWWLYSDSEMTTPARKAPSARDNPSEDVSQAMPRQERSEAIRKISRTRIRTIRCRIRGMRKRATAKTPAMARMLKTKRRPIAVGEADPELARTGTRATIGTMARS